MNDWQILNKSDRLIAFNSKLTPWVLVFAAVSVLAFLGSRGLGESNEGGYAEMARELTAPGDWLALFFNDPAQSRTPPFTSSCAAASFKLFGVSEWAARLPSALAALGTIWLTFVTGRKLFGEFAGMAATVVLATAFGFFFFAKTITPDIFVTLWMTAAFSAFVCWTKTPSHKWKLWIFFASMGLGLLTSGLTAPVTAVFGAVGWQAARKRAGAPVRIAWLRGGLLALTIGLSRCGFLSVTHPALFRRYVSEVIALNFLRFNVSLFHIPLLLVGLLPWTFFLPALTRWLSMEYQRAERFCPEWWLIGAWATCPFAILSFSATKYSASVLPLYPPIALALGAWWTATWRLRDFTKEGVAAALFFLVLTFGSIVAPHFASSPIDSVSLSVTIASTLATFVIGVVLLPARPDPIIVSGTIALAATIVWVAVLLDTSGWAGSLLGRTPGQ